MYITSTGPLEEKKLFAGQGLAGSHANFSRYVSNTRKRLPRRTAELILHILFIVSVHLGIS